MLIFYKIKKMSYLPSKNLLYFSLMCVIIETHRESLGFSPKILLKRAVLEHICVIMHKSSRDRAAW